MREAIVQLTDEELERLGFREVVEATRAAGLQDVTELVCHGEGGILQVRVDEPLPADALDRFESVVWWERLAASETAVTYLLKVEPTDTAATYALDEHATAHDVSTAHEGGVELSVVGSQEEISRSIATMDEAGKSPLLRRLTDFEGADQPSIEGLTERQREVVETAYSMGYYEVPRSASTDDVAEAVGLDRSTVAEHLQRAERNVLGQLLEDRV